MSLYQTKSLDKISQIQLGTIRENRTHSVHDFQIVF